MLVVENLLHTKEIGERVVESSLHIALVGPTIGEVGGEGPAVGVDARVVGVHRPHAVVAVGACHRDPLTLCHSRRAEVVVVGTSHSRHSEIVGLEGQGVFHTFSLLVQTAYERETELPRFHIVHWGTVDVDLIVLLVKSTELEAYGAEQISYL